MTAPHVYSAITAMTAALAREGIAKGRHNQQQGYAFRGIDDVYSALASKLAENKLCILPRVTNRQVVERQNSKGTVLFYTALTVEFDLVSAIDGSKHTICTVGEAMDSGDKSGSKAMSAAYKYACLQAFCIPTEGDNDADHTTHDVQPAAVARPRAMGPRITPAQENAMAELIAATQTDPRKFCEHYGVADLDELRVPEFERAMRQLQAKAARRPAATPQPVGAGHAEFLAAGQ